MPPTPCFCAWRRGGGCLRPALLTAGRWQSQPRGFWGRPIWRIIWCGKRACPFARATGGWHGWLPRRAKRARPLMHLRMPTLPVASVGKNIRHFTPAQKHQMIFVRSLTTVEAGLRGRNSLGGDCPATGGTGSFVAEKKFLTKKPTGKKPSPKKSSPKKPARKKSTSKTRKTR